VPGVVLEAGWLDLPVVASRVGGVPDCVVDQETGVLVEAADEDEFAHAALALLNDDVRSREIGENAHRWIEEKFTMQKIAARFEDFYIQIRGAA